MKKIFKRLAAITLVFALMLSFSPSNVMAASKNCGSVTKASSGKVSSIIYGSAKGRKAGFTISSELVEDTTTDKNEDFIEYKTYRITVKFTRPSYSKHDILSIQNNLNRIKTKGWEDFKVIVIDGNGDFPRGITLQGGFDADSSSKPQTLTAKHKSGSFSLHGYRKTEVYKYKLLVEADHDPVYIGVAGLRNGQITNAAKNNYKQGKINFYEAGFGSKKKGYAYVQRIN